ncbi:MAG TPA: glycoside hydrolase family 36 protein [Puia sp.]|nr:glycoside hydrolase family 36 protein [Puia sp.]
MRSLLLSIPILLLSTTLSAQADIVRNKDLRLAVNNHLQTQITSLFPGSKPLMSGFAFSEYLATKYYTAEDFLLTRKVKSRLQNQSGTGTRWLFYGTSSRHRLEKILSVTTYDQFPNSAYIQAAYINHGHNSVEVEKWGNNRYEIIPSTDKPRFFSFQGSSHSDRRDWIQKVNPGFYESNFMGMNASDYGGGIPVTDLWRKDAGIAVGHTAKVAQLVCLPVDYDSSAAGASIGVEYKYPSLYRLAPGDTLRTVETFVSVHQKDCFATLRNYGSYMATRGIKAAASEPAAYEPVWCAWGYERDFTLSEILKTLPKVKQLGIKWVGLDDGFQQAEGDWHTNKEHFPGGDAQMKAFVDSIHAQGMKAVLWWAPLAADPDSKLLRNNRHILIQQKDGSPQYITWWDSYYMSPTDATVLEETKKTVELFMRDWGFDALKLDGQHMNACAPDYARGHNITRPEQSFEDMPLLFRTIFETARSIKPGAVVEFCPCGDCMNFYHMPYTNQFVASDPESSWQVRLKGKVYKALMPGTAYFGDHVELTDDHADFASQLGIGAVPGTKFVWPATGIAKKDVSYLSPEKEVLFNKYLGLYNEKMLSTGDYRGDLYDIGYDYPETHCIQKGKLMYYAFYNPAYTGTVQLRGLDEDAAYQVTDYVNGRDLGTVKGPIAMLKLHFEKSLLLEVKKLPSR